MSLRYRMSILVGLALLPPIGLLTYDTIETRERERRALFDEARNQAVLAAGQFEAIIQGAQRLSWALSHQTRVVTADPRCPELMRALVNEVPLFRAGIVTDRSGKVVCSWPRAEGEVNLSDREYFTRAMAGLDLAVGTLILRGSSALPLARRYSTDSEPEGVIILGLDLDLIARGFRERYDWTNRHLSVLDRENTIILSVPGQDEAVGRRMPDAAATAIAGQTTGAFEGKDTFGRPAIIGFARVEGLLVSVGYDQIGVLPRSRAPPGATHCSWRSCCCWPSSRPGWRASGWCAGWSTGWSTLRAASRRASARCASPSSARRPSSAGSRTRSTAWRRPTRSC